MSEENPSEDRTATSSQEAARFRTLAEHVPNGGVALFDDELRHTLALGGGSTAPTAAEDTGTRAPGDSVAPDPTAIEGKTLREVFPPGRYEAAIESVRERYAGLDSLAVPSTYEDLAATYRDVLAGEERTFEVPFAGRLYRVHAVPIDTADGRADVGMLLAQDVTEARERERRLNRQHAELERLNRIHRLIEDVIEALTVPTTRGEIETVVCERLTESDLYTSTTVVERAVEAETFTPRTWAGIDRSYLETIADSGSDTIDEGSVWNVLRTGDTQVVQRIAADTRIPEPMRVALIDRGIESVIVLPLAHGDRIEGALVVRADRPEAFSEREQAALETLADAVSFAIRAARNQSALLADAAVELEFEIPASGSFFAAISRQLACTCIHEGEVPVGDGSIHHYVRVEGASAADVVDLAEDHDAIDWCRIVDDDEDAGRLEVVVPASPSRIFLGTGATLRSIVAQDGTSTVVAEVSGDVSVRRVVDAFLERYPEAQLVAKRDVGATRGTANRLRERLEDRLTDKQLTALRTAYLSGYYDRPRESTVQEMADSLGVADTTLHQHLQAAQRKLLDEFFGRSHEPG